MKLTPAQIKHYRDRGYLVVPGVFTPEAAAAMADHYMWLRAQGPRPHDMGGDANNPNDPLNRFPRFINMHPWDPATRAWAYERDNLAIVRQLIRDEPVLHQTMLYFKPAGARGQGLHQDEQYITIDPLIGVWVALDDCDKANGQMVVVPGSHKLGMLQVEPADESSSFTSGQTRMPKGAKQIGVDMKAGDVLFFDGKCIHGSYPNVTKNRFRRSFICHYVGKHAKKFVPAQGTHMTHVAAK